MIAPWMRPRFDAARCTRMSYTLAEAAAAPSDFAECYRPSRGRLTPL